MNVQNSDSDTSDEDFVPIFIGECISEDDSSGDGGEEDVSDEVEIEPKRGKRKILHKKRSTPNKKRKYQEEQPAKKVVQEVSEEEEKQISDKLWDDFKMTTKSPAAETKRVQVQSQVKLVEENKYPVATKAGIEKEPNSSVAEDNAPKFAVPRGRAIPSPANKAQISKGWNIPTSQGSADGKAIPARSSDTLLKLTSTNNGSGVVSESVHERIKGYGMTPLPTSGLVGIVQKMGKKDKLGTLEQSKIAWSNFTKSQELHEDLKAHNQGKHGYIEKLEFLDRANMRQYEIEKGTRLSSKRSH